MAKKHQSRKPQQRRPLRAAGACTTLPPFSEHVTSLVGAMTVDPLSPGWAWGATLPPLPLLSFLAVGEGSEDAAYPKATRTCGDMTDPNSTATRPRRGPGRPLAADGLTSVERAARDVDAALVGHRCAVCAAPATTARTAPGEPSLAQLRLGERPARRAQVLADLSDYRCGDHRLSRPRSHGALTSTEYSSGRIAEFLSSRTCVDPGCSLTPTGAITAAGLPGLGQIRSGLSPACLDAALASAVVYCAPHLAARTACGIDPTVGHDPQVAAFGGPHALILALVGVRTVTALARRLGTAEDAVLDLYERIGVGVGTLFVRRGGRAPDCSGAGDTCRRGTLCVACSRWYEELARIERLGDLDWVLRGLAAAVSTKDLSRRVRGNDSGGVVRTLRKALADLGVDLSTYWSQRLLHY